MKIETASESSSAPKRVLVVDDDATQLKLIRLRLESEGYDVVTTTSPTEGLRRLKEDPPDAVLSDVLMGEMDGFCFCRRIRAEPSLDGVPVILLSAHYDEESDRELAERVGASGLVKRTPTLDAEVSALVSSLGARARSSLAPMERATYEQHLRTNAHLLSKLLNQATRAEERYRKLLEQAHDAIMITRIDGTIMEANGRWCDVLGVRVDELVGQNVNAWAANTGDAWALTDEIVRAGVGTLGPLPFVSRSGRTVQMVLSLSIVEVEGESLVLSIGNDITDMIESSRAVARIEERYRSLVERIPDVIWTKSTDDSTTFFTPNAEKVFGEPLACIMTAELGVRLSRVHRDEAVHVREAFATYFEIGTPFDIEYRYRRKDGRWIWLRERAFPLAKGARAHLGEGMISDITERKRLEDDLRQSQKMEALGQLTGGIAHDFNNILATILANAQFIIDALPEGDAQRNDAEAIRDAGDRAANLTRQLLAFSRRQVLEARVVDLNAAVSGVQRMLRSVIRENIAVTFVPSLEPGCVRIDLGQLEQVIMNLVVNACDAMPAGGTLTIETETDQANERVLLRVRDTGEGMDESTLRRIFEPFFTTKEKGRGTGLGLATCYGIVQQSGGRIVVESEPGAGTTFTIELPRVEEQPGSGPRIEVAPDVMRSGRETVLLIEDDAAVRTVVKRLLGRNGYHVLDAQDASEALAIGLDDIPIDLVLSDIILPGAAGPHIVERIRAKRPNLKALFVSGYSDLPSLGGPDVIAKLRIIEKPFRPEKLLSAVRDELARV